MDPPRLARRRQPANVYRMRRAMVATGVVLAGFALLTLVDGVGGGGSEDAVTTTSSATTTTIPPVPPCSDGEVEVSGDPASEWATILVDTARALPAGYAPPDLRNIAEAGFPFTEGAAVRALVIPDLDALRQAAADNGTPLTILAAHRGRAQQADLYKRRVDELGGSEAGSRVARPGHSEHQLGTAVDLATEGDTDVDQSWGATPQGQWVATNAHKFGFLLSYPMEATEATCYDYEPWHLRYVGRELASEVITSGLSLREFLWRLNPVDITTTTAPP